MNYMYISLTKKFLSWLLSSGIKIKSVIFSFYNKGIFYNVHAYTCTLLTSAPTLHDGIDKCDISLGMGGALIEDCRWTCGDDEVGGA